MQNLFLFFNNITENMVTNIAATVVMHQAHSVFPQEYCIIEAVHFGSCPVQCCLCFHHYVSLSVRLLHLAPTIVLLLLLNVLLLVSASNSHLLTKNKFSFVISHIIYNLSVFIISTFVCTHTHTHAFQIIIFPSFNNLRIVLAIFLTLNHSTILEDFLKTKDGKLFSHIR